MPPPAPSGAAIFCSSSCSSPKIPSNDDHNLHTSLTPKPITLVQKHPLYAPTHTNLSLRFKEKIICLELIGVDAGKALSQNPSLQSATLHSIHHIIYFLQSKHIRQKDLGRIFDMCPKILTSNPRTDLDPVFTFLSTDLNVPEHNFRRVINKCPRLLVSSVERQLKPALSYLQQLGFKDIESLAYKDPVLLVSSVENTLIPKLDYLVSLGFSKDGAVGMVLRCPSLFTFSVQNNYKPKLEYFSKEMMGDLKELMEFPQYFSFSLEKRIKIRHKEMVHACVKVPLAMMLKATDEEFKELIREGRYE